jgi:hypothetical protein
MVHMSDDLPVPGDYLVFCKAMINRSGVGPLWTEPGARCLVVEVREFERRVHLRVLLANCLVLFRCDKHAVWINWRRIIDTDQ